MTTIEIPRPTERTGLVDGGRSVHLVDLENLAGGPSQPPDLVLDVWRRYQVIADATPTDHITLATERALWKRIAFDIDPSVRYLPGTGPDGADTALIASATAEWVVGRFDRLVIGSGDCAFASLAGAVRAAGRPVVVVAVPGSLSGRLRAVATEVRWLPASTPTDLALAA
jgi:hypothetical protein